MIKNFEQFNLIKESVTKNEIIDFFNDFGFFISLNLMKVGTYAIDENSKNELLNMQKTLRNPLINGKSYNELLNDINIIIKNPKYLSSLLSQVKGLIEFIEPRINKYVIDNEFKKNWLDKIKKFKDIYLKIIKD